uniref:(northern house mosquito) hypothetical protein n=1 Tax=Culex pipiens TaxID=7175 RepID=A0A8D8CMT3_CULPI
MSISMLIRVEGRARSMMLIEGSFRISDGSLHKLFSALDSIITELFRVDGFAGRKLTRGGGTSTGTGFAATFTVFAFAGAFFLDFLAILKLPVKSQIHAKMPTSRTKL